MAAQALFINPSFEALLEVVRDSREMSWANIEDRFMAIVSDVDTLVFDGRLRTDSAEYKAKARYFNDLIAALLINRTGKGIATRTKRQGLSFPKHDLDLAYPSADDSVLVAAGEVKIAGAPAHPNNKSTGPLGREVAKDLDKRIREMGFTAVDLKRFQANGPLCFDGAQNQPGVPRSAGPLYVVVMATRVATDRDLKAIQDKLRALDRHYADGVGLFLYRAIDRGQQTTYVKIDPGAGLRIDEVLSSFSLRVARS